jgi:hypothetical protein
MSPVKPSMAKTPWALLSNSFSPAPTTMSRMPSLFKSDARGDDWEPMLGILFYQIRLASFSSPHEILNKLINTVK